jgi:hypothetical protein
MQSPISKMKTELLRAWFNGGSKADEQLQLVNFDDTFLPIPQGTSFTFYLHTYITARAKF